MKELEYEIAAQEDVVSQLNPDSAKYAEELAKLDAMKAQFAAMEAQETIASQFDNLDFGDGMTVSLREACANEEYYQLLSMWMQKYIGDQAQKHAAVVASYKGEVEAMEYQLHELDACRAEADRLGGLLADMTAKRDAAATELMESKLENERLEKDNESLRKQLEGQNAPATPQVDPAELYRRIQAAKPGIYNKRWFINERGLEDRRYFTANLSETGEEITIPQLEIGKYREESQEEAERFRAEQAQAELDRLAQETHNVVVPDLQFPSEDAGVQTDAVPGPVATEDDEIRRRLERLERAVFGEVKDVA